MDTKNPITHEKQSAFARRCGVNRATVTRWKAAGRLVLDAKGRVDIDASLQRLESTQGVRHDVLERWRTYRAAQGRPAGFDAAAPTQPTAPPAQPAPAPAPHPAPAADLERIDVDEIGRRTRIAQMLKEEAVARQKQREDQELAGVLIRRADVRKDLEDSVSVILGAWETLPDRVAPLLVNVDDQARIRALLRDEIERVCGDVATQLADVGARKFEVGSEKFERGAA
jgi:hypothetical protein